jgi:hypothetical protein
VLAEDVVRGDAPVGVAVDVFVAAALIDVVTGARTVAVGLEEVWPTVVPLDGEELDVSSPGGGSTLIDPPVVRSGNGDPEVGALGDDGAPRSCARCC